MKDQADNQTVELFPAPRRRGRPSTGQAKSAAERMKAYRARKRAGQVQLETTVIPVIVTENSEIEQLRGRISALKDALALSESRNDVLNSEIDRLKGDFRLVIEERDDIKDRHDFIVRAAESERARLNKEIEKLKKRNATKKGERVYTYSELVSVLESSMSTCLGGSEGPYRRQWCWGAWRYWDMLTHGYQDDGDSRRLESMAVGLKS